jgi:hypothetical protein
MSRLWISHVKCHFVFFIFGDLRWEENTRLVTTPTIVASIILIDEPFTGTDCNNNCTPHTQHGERERIRKQYPFPVIIEYVNSSNILKWSIIMSDSMLYHNIQTNILYINSGSMTRPTTMWPLSDCHTLMSDTRYRSIKK